MSDTENPALTATLTAIAELESAILSKHPTMPGLLKQIHATLKQYPECVTLLPPDQIAVIIRGIESQTQTSLASSITSTSKKTSAKNTLLAQLKAAGGGANVF